MSEIENLQNQPHEPNPQEDLDKPVTPQHFNRKHLMTDLLENRQVLRMLIAPAGFGKTTSVREYVTTVFPEGHVVWVDARDPSFICALDEGNARWDRIFDVLVWKSAAGEVDAVHSCDDTCDADDACRGDNMSAKRDQRAHPAIVDNDTPPPLLPTLVVIEDIPQLEGGRSKVLSKMIDVLLAERVEVIITCTPSNDCLSGLQADRIVLSAYDFIVTDEEYREAMGSEPDYLLAANLHRMVYGIPSLVWASSLCALQDCMRGVFDERLSTDVLIPAIVMLLLQNGRFVMLEHAGVRITHEVKELFASSCPMFGVDLRADTFSTLWLSPTDIRDLAEPIIVEGERWYDLLDLLVDELTETGSLDRAIEVLLDLCPQRSRRRWLFLPWMGHHRFERLRTAVHADRFALCGNAIGRW